MSSQSVNPTLPMFPHRPASHLADNDTEEGCTGRDGEDVDTGHSKNYTFSYHGSCPKCHHLHTNKPLRLYIWSAFEHVRVRCEKCEYQIFGIGRTSTQTTLASIESIPSPQLALRNTSISRLPPQQVCRASPAESPPGTNPSGPENIAATTPLTTIDEANTSAGRSRSTSNVQSPNGASFSPDGATRSSPARAKVVPIPGQGPSSGPRENSQPSGSWRHPFAKLRSVLRRAIHSHRGRSGGKWWEGYGSDQNTRTPSRRETDGAGSRHHDRSQRAKIGHPKPVLQENLPSVQVTLSRSLTPSLAEAPGLDVASLRGDDGLTPRARIWDSTGERDVSSREPGSTMVNPTPASGGSEVEVDANRPGAPNEIFSPSIGSSQEITEPDAVKNKHDRIYARRREKTLHEKAVTLVCDCHVGCHCHGHGNGRASSLDIASDLGGSLTSRLEVPDHPLVDGLASTPDRAGPSLPAVSIGTHLSAIGGHFDFNRRSGPLSAVFQARRLSQATTIHSSSSSSLSLPGGRGYLGPSPSRLSGPRLRPEPSDAMQQYDRVHRHRPSFIRDDSGINPEFSRHPSEETMDEAIPTHTRTIRGVNNTESQSRWLLPIEDRPPSLSVATTNISMAGDIHASESQEATPRPGSHHDPSEEPWTSSQPEAAVLSSALRGITSTTHFVVD